MNKIKIILIIIFTFLFFLSMGGSSLTGKDYTFQRIYDHFDFGLDDNLEFLIKTLNLKTDENKFRYYGKGLDIYLSNDRISSIRLHSPIYKAFRGVKVNSDLKFLKKKYKNNLNCDANYCFMKNKDGIVLKFLIIENKVKEIVLFRDHYAN